MKSLPMTKKRNRPNIPDNVLVMVPMGIAEKMLYIPRGLDEEQYLVHMRAIIRDFLRGPKARFVHEVAKFGQANIVSYFDDWDEAVWEIIWEVLQEPEFCQPPRARRKSTSSKRRKR